MKQANVTKRSRFFYTLLLQLEARGDKMRSSVFSIRLKEIRLSRGFTQEYIAQLIDISRPTYSNYETGFREPSIQVICRIADIFDINTDWLFGRTDIKEPYPK